MKLSVLIPAYNEAATVTRAVQRLADVPWPCEVEFVAVDDGSTDETAALLAAIEEPRLRVLRHETNRGKGAALRTAAQAATGDYLVVYDADLEYDPRELLRLAEPVLAGEAEVVLGARTFGSTTAHSFWFVMGNKLTTLAANALFNSWISDLHCCYKLLPRSLFLDLDLRENGFGLDTEVVAKLLARGIRPFEVPVSYHARTFEEGKKISWRDGVDSLRLLLMIRLRQRKRLRTA